MDATQIISDPISESDEEKYEEENKDKRGQPLAKLCILKNEHIPETEFPLFLGDNVLGRDPNTCTLTLSAPSISKQHATICISVYRRKGCHTEMDIEALVWDLGSMNGTRKGRLKLTPEVRYALSDGDSLVVADIPCQYVSCAVNTVSSHGNLRTPVSRKSLVKVRLPDASGKKGGDTSTGSKKCVNGGTKSGVSLARSPVRTSCLSYEQTPTQPQGTLVPKSDSESEDERWAGGPRMCKALVSDSDSHKSSPTCSTFLSPISKIVPESEDESPITPSSSTKNRPYSKARNVSPTEDDELPVCTAEVSKHAIPAFKMDSDTDMEGEEEGLLSAGPVTLNTNQVNQPPTTDQFHLDSDTDVDEDEDALEKTVPSSDDIKPSHVISVIQPEGVTLDSDTDVDDNAAVSDAATKTKPMSFHSACTADSVLLMQPKDFCLDSDTDVDEEEETECGKNKLISKMDASHTRLDIKSVGPDSTPAAPHILHLDSDKFDKVMPTPAVSEAPVMFAATESCTTPDTGANILDILPDSDTDVEDDSPLVIPVSVTTLSVSSTNMPAALQSDSDADTDVDECNVPPVGDMDNPAELRMDSGTDGENKEAEIQEAGDGQIPDLCREQTPGLLLPLLHNCSTPVQVSEGEVENMEALAFLSPSSVPVRCVEAPAVALSSCSDSQVEEDFVVAETQSFILQTRDCQGNPSGDHTMDHIHAFGLEPSDDERDQQSSKGRSFQLGLSDSSYLQCQAQDLAMESTQAFVLGDRNVNLENTQAYASISSADRATGENATNLQATQAYGVDEEPARCSVMSEKEDQVDMALEATQAYISEPYSDSENETEPTSGAETQPLDFPTSSSLAMAETQPMSAFEEEESLVSSAQQVKPRTQNETEGGKEDVEVAQPQERLLSETLFVAETQPMQTCEDEDSNDEHSVPQTLTHTELCAMETQPVVAVQEGESDEDLISGPRKRKAKPLQLEEEQTQPFTNFELSIVETQPMHIGVPETQPMALRGKEEMNAEPEEEKTPMLINSELSTVETQPMDTVEESEEEDSIPVSLKRRAKPLQLEETPPLSNSERVCAFETQPTGTCEDEESSDEDSFPGPHKRKPRPLQLEDEQTQPLTNSEVETQPTVMGEDEESSDEKSLIAKSDVQSERVREGQSEPGTSGVTVRNKRGTQEKLREDEPQEKCSDPPKTKRRGKNKALPNNRGKSRLDEDESEEEEEVEQVKRAGEKKSMSQQKDKDEEDQFEAEQIEHVESNNLIKEKHEGRMDEKKDVANLRQQGIEKMEKGNGQVCERQREQEEIEGQHRAEQEQLERERKVMEEQERFDAENAERIRLEKAKERKEQEENERYEQIQKAKEQLERERRENEEKDRIACEKAQREEKDKLMRKEKEIAEKERKEQEEKEKIEQKESLERERKEQEHQARLEKEKEAKEIEEQQKNKVPTRGRRGARRTIATLPEQDSTISTNDDVPARRTRSRSNSSNSVSSERSASSLNIQESRGRGRGRGVKRTSELPQAATARSSNRRRTVAAETSQQDSNDVSLQGLHSVSNSSNSLNSDISSCSVISQTRGRGGRQRGRGRKTEPYSIPPLNNHSDQNSASKPAARGRKSRRAEGPSNEEEKVKADAQQASTTRVRQRASTHGSESATADEEEHSNQEGCHASEESPLTKRNVRGRGQKAVKSETLETPGVPAVSDGAEAKDKRIRMKRELVQNTEEDSSSSSKIYRGNEKAQPTGAAEEEGKDEIKDENPVQAKKRGRASSVQAKKNAKEPPPKVEVKEESENMELETVRKRARGRPSAVQKKQKEEQEDNSETSVSSMSQDANVVASQQPQTPTSSVSRKRQTPVDSCPVAKTPRSTASPVTSGRLRMANQGYKVLFTGVMDEAGERVLTRLGGSMAEGVADMNCLVTDKVRRTVKFLCAVAKGIPIVTTHWLEKSGKAGSFLPPNAFVVKDPEQEKKFSFSLQESLKAASSQPLLQGYQIHVTKSVKPEPIHMKDIISCSGATFLPKMPSSHKLQTVVISCEEDWLLCCPAVSASLPVVTAEFILTGILQQKLDFQVHTLSAPAANPQPAGGKGRSRKKT